MATLAYSRKKRQLKQLSEKLQTVLLQGQESSGYVQKLVAKIRLLVNELRQTVSTGELKKALGGLAVFFGLAMAHSASAQTFAAPVQNPFGLSSVQTYAMPAFADLDGDGDLDLMVGEEYGVMNYFKNIGTAGNPQFAAAVANPFGIDDSSFFYLTPTFADLDGDGDQDLLLGDFYDYYGNTLKYLENTGTATSPQFAAAVVNPFGITSPGYSALPTFVDLDDDGDFDLMVGEAGGGMKYYQNTGTSTNPQFGAPQSSPFGITNTYYFAAPAFADLDKDGDLDLLVGEYYGALQYFKNTGSKTSPQFAAPQSNPFGLSPTLYGSYPTFADLDGDGDKDLLVGEYYGNMQYFKNTSPGVGLSETPAFEMQVFPNPATSVVEIKTTEAIKRVEILDVTSKILLKVNEPTAPISLDGLPKGSYLLKVIDRDDRAVIQKLQKA